MAVPPPPAPPGPRGGRRDRLTAAHGTDGPAEPAHTLPWWYRFERRSILSLAKRLTSPRGEALAARVPALRILAGRFLSRIATVRVEVCGAPFRLDVMRRSVSRSIFLGGRWHANVVRLLRTHVRPGMVAVDVGANVGYMAVHMADVAGPDGTVLAFEPEPRNFAVLAENARTARWRNIVPIAAALGERSGTIDLHLSLRDGGDHRTAATEEQRPTVRVPVQALDEVVAMRRTPVHFVKMDIQGAEAAALRGAREVLARRELKGLVLEFWPGALRDAGEDPSEVLARLAQAGLRCANEPALDADPRGWLSAAGDATSRDLLFLR